MELEPVGVSGMPEHSCNRQPILPSLRQHAILSSQSARPRWTMNTLHIFGAVPNQSSHEPTVAQFSEHRQSCILRFLGHAWRPDPIVPEVNRNLSVVRLHRLGKLFGLLDLSQSLQLGINVNPVRASLQVLIDLLVLERVVLILCEFSRSPPRLEPRFSRVCPNRCPIL